MYCTDYHCAFKYDWPDDWEIIMTPAPKPKPLKGIKPLKGMLRPNLSEAKWVDDGTKEGNWEGVFFEMYDGENWIRIK